MAKQVIWSPMAINDLAGILQYLQKPLNQKVASDFIGQVSKVIESIRKIVISRQNTIYYRVKRNQIIILRIFDSRQDPNRLTFL